MKELDDLEREGAIGPCDHTACGGHDLVQPITCSECGFGWPTGSCSYNVILCWPCQAYVCYEIGPCALAHLDHQGLPINSLNHS